MIKRMALLSVLAIAACNTASVPPAPAASDAEGKKFDAPPPGMGALYIARTGDGGTLINVSVGQRTLGPLGNFNWFRVDLPPGTANVRCAGGENVQDLQVPITAGEIKYIKTRASIGWQTLRCSLYEVDTSEGQGAVREGSRAAEVR